MKKLFKLLLALLLLIGGFALSLSSCSDKDVNETEVFDPSDPYGKTTDDAEALLSILYSTADIDSLPNDWNKANYKEEPTISKVLDEANPYVRSTGAVSAEEAISFFNSITSSSVQKNATSASWSKEGIGSLNLNVVNKDGVYATIDVHVQQLPHLTQIRFIDKNLLGENADDKPAYYKIGDVVSTVEDGQTIYWVCVRNCNKSFSKGKSHWVSFQLSDKNYKTYQADATKDRAQMIVPANLSESPSVTEDIENAVKLFVALSNPTAYDEIDAFKNGLGGFGKVTYPATTIVKLANQWRKNNIRPKLLPSGLNSQDWLTYNDMHDNGESYKFYYHGYKRSGSNMKLYRTTISLNGTSSFEKQEDNATWEWDQKTINIKTYVQNGSRICNGITADNPIERTGEKALVIRCKTGRELCGLDNWYKTKNDPDYTQAFPKDAPVKVTEVFRYNESASDDFIVGDMARGSDGALWTCILSPCNGNNKTIFITTDNITPSKNNMHATNKDLPNVDDAFTVFPILCFLLDGLIGENSTTVRSFVEKLQNPKLGGIPLDRFLAEYHKGNAWQESVWTTTFALKRQYDMSEQSQDLLRMYQHIIDDRPADRNDGIKYIGFTRYQANTAWDGNTKGPRMLLSDINTNKIERLQKYIVGDSLCRIYNHSWRYTGLTNKNVLSYIYNRESNYFGDDDYYSIFNEPITFIRVKILNPNEKAADLSLTGTNLIDNMSEYKTWIEDMLAKWNNKWSQNTPTLDGVPMTISYQ